AETGQVRATLAHVAVEYGVVSRFGNNRAYDLRLLPMRVALQRRGGHGRDLAAVSVQEPHAEIRLGVECFDPQPAAERDLLAGRHRDGLRGEPPRFFAGPHACRAHTDVRLPHGHPAEI